MIFSKADQARYNELIDKWFDKNATPLTHEEINELDALAVAKAFASAHLPESSEAPAEPAP